MAKDTGVIISRSDCGYLIKAVGRANFDYAVPLRDLSKELTGSENLCFDLSACTAMDSTFMGVMSMLGLKARKSGGAIEIAGAGANLKLLLAGLGVDKLFTFVDAVPDMAGEFQAKRTGSMIDTAETVLEAHQKLVEAEPENAKIFDQVIKFAKSDVDRLKREERQP